MKVGLVSTWCEKGAAYLTRIYADFLKKNGHEVFIYARGGNIGYQQTGDWIDKYNVYFQKFSCIDLARNVPAAVPNSQLAIAEDWALYNQHNIGKFNEQSALTWIDIDEFSPWCGSSGVEVVLFNEQKDLTAIHFCRERSIKTIYFGTDPCPYEPRHYEQYDHVIWHTECNKEAMPCKNGTLILWGIETNGAWCRFGKKQKVVFYFNAGTDFCNGRKGHDFVLQIWDLVRKSKFCNPSLVIHSILDMSYLGRDELRLCKEMINDSSLQLIIGKAGFPGFYKHGNVYLYPARKDGIGLTILEAMYHGMPLITPDTKPFNEYVIDGVTGTTIKNASVVGNMPWTPVHQVDIEETANTCIQYASDPTLIYKHGQATIELLKSKFDFNKNHVKLLELL